MIEAVAFIVLTILLLLLGAIVRTATKRIIILEQRVARLEAVKTAPKPTDPVATFKTL